MTPPSVYGARRRGAAAVLTTAVALCASCSSALARAPHQASCSARSSQLRAPADHPCSALSPALDPFGLGSNLAGAPGGVSGLPGSLGGAPGSLGGGAGSLGAAPGSLGQGVAGIGSTATTGLALSTIGSWVSGSADFVLHETAHVLAQTTAPRLGSTWFSGTYWRVARIAAVLTLPFLFAASIQALIGSDLALLVRAALGYLPLSMLAVAIAAPLTMLLLSASDELAAAVSSAAGHQSVDFLDRAISPLGALGTISGSPFLAFLVALFTVAAALILWLELLMREAAVYVIVLMLPLAFAAFVWPARRIWAIRSLEVLFALILSKFAIVAVLSLGGAALSQGANGSLAGLLAGVVLLVLGAFAPWALLRLLPLTELASGAAGALRSHSGTAVRGLRAADAWATEAQRWTAATAHMRRLADRAAPTASSAAQVTDTAPFPMNDNAGSGADIGAASGAVPRAASASQDEARPSPPGEPLEAAGAPAAGNAPPNGRHPPDASDEDAAIPRGQWILEGPDDLTSPNPPQRGEEAGT